MFNLPPFDTATLSRGVPKICQNGSPKCVFRGAESDCIRLSKTRRFWEPRLRDSNLFAARFLTKCVRPTNGSALIDETIPVASLWLWESCAMGTESHREMKSQGISPGFRSVLNPYQIECNTSRLPEILQSLAASELSGDDLIVNRQPGTR